MQPDNRPNDADDTATGAEQAAIEPAPLPTYIRRNRRTIRASSFAAAAGTGLVFALPSAWTWFLDQDLDPAQGTVIGGIFVGIAATIAYTGTHLSRKSTERIAADKNTIDTTNADRAHDLTVTQELRARFVTIAAQFADPTPEIRLAAVYALEALTDDWIDRGAHHEAQTCINYYCGYLTRPYAPPTEHPHLRQTVVTPDAATTIQRTYTHPHDDLHVRQIITRTIAAHTQPRHHHSWSGFDYDLDRAYLHNADFANSHFTQNVSFRYAQFHGGRTSFDWAEFHGELTSFGSAEFHGEVTSFRSAGFHSRQTSFRSARFHGESTLFSRTRFHGESTSFSRTRFHGESTLFSSAEFHGESTSFGSAEFHGELTSFDSAEFRSRDLTSFGEAVFHGHSTSFDRTRFHGESTSFSSAEFHGESTSFDRAEFHGKVTSFGSAEFHGKVTSFDSAEFRSRDLTSFSSAEFRSRELTSFGEAEFHGKLTSFGRAEFHSEQTWFMSPRAWGNVSFDWDPQFPYAVIAPKPVTVLPAEWPPTVIDPA